MIHPGCYSPGVKSSIQKVLQDHFEAHCQTHKVPLRVRKAGQAIRKCRTARLGGHIQKCPDGHVERVWYNSCKHRACPVCAFMQITRWIHQQIRKLLHCDYYHTIFTIPSEFNSLWEFNRRLFTDLLFRAAWHSLKELLADPKYLGALPGAIASFHSWAQTLIIHPHLHFLVTGGGLTPQGQWLTVRDEFLLPSRVLSAKFRGKFLAFLRQALQESRLLPPPDLSPQRVLNLLNKLGRAKWHVQIMPPYKHGRGVIDYLGAYVRGGPVSSRRVTLDSEDSILLRYKDETRTRTLFMPLSIHEFLTRLLRHVPERGVHHARGYGLFAPGKREQLNAARKLLGQLPVAPPEEISWQTACSLAGPLHPELCPVCGKPLIRIELSPTGLSPPCRKVA